jgi:hypothetical protein
MECHTVERGNQGPGPGFSTDYRATEVMER